MALKLIEEYINIGLSANKGEILLGELQPLEHDKTTERLHEIAQAVSSNRSYLHVTHFFDLLDHESTRIRLMSAQHILEFFDPEIYPIDKAIDTLEQSQLKSQDKIKQLIRKSNVIRTERMLLRSRVFGDKISARLFAVGHNLREVVRAYDVSTRDALLDVGLEYNKDYVGDEWYRQKYFEYEMLEKERNHILFTTILNFTQSFYSLKDYMIKSHPQFRTRIEKFFSRGDESRKPRKSIANDLKHNPDNDVEYRFEEAGRETIHTPGKISTTSYMKHSWFYEDSESAEHCTSLFSDLLLFLNQLTNEFK